MAKTWEIPGLGWILFGFVVASLLSSIAFGWTFSAILSESASQVAGSVFGAGIGALGAYIIALFTLRKSREGEEELRFRIAVALMNFLLRQTGLLRVAYTDHFSAAATANNETNRGAVKRLVLADRFALMPDITLMNLGSIGQTVSATFPDWALELDNVFFRVGLARNEFDSCICGIDTALIGENNSTEMSKFQTNLNKVNRAAIHLQGATKDLKGVLEKVSVYVKGFYGKLPTAVLAAHVDTARANEIRKTLTERHDQHVPEAIAALTDTTTKLSKFMDSIDLFLGPRDRNQ